MSDKELKLKEKEKAKALKDKEKTKALKEKEKAKALKEKAQKKTETAKVKNYQTKGGGEVKYMDNNTKVAFNRLIELYNDFIETCNSGNCNNELGKSILKWISWFPLKNLDDYVTSTDIPVDVIILHIQYNVLLRRDGIYITNIDEHVKTAAESI